MSSKQKPSTFAKSVVISIGTELTGGLVQDRHLGFLGQELVAIGIRVIKALQIPDEMDLIVKELQRAYKECDVIFVSGGLGPTEDDLTREAISSFVSKDLIFHQEVFDKIIARFQRIKVAESNKKQACCPEGFKFLPNPHGSAPGFYGKKDHCHLFALPGPPRELQPMFLNHVRPYLKQAFQLKDQRELVFNSYLISESLLQDVFSENKVNDVSLSTRLETDRIIGTLRGEKDEDLKAVLVALKAYFDGLRVQKKNEFLGERIVRCLKEADLKLVLAESCTGGLVAEWITRVAGSSHVFWGGVVSYANEAKNQWLSVIKDIFDQNGAVSKESVLAMLKGALAVSKAQVAIAITGVAGPSGGTDDKPVGTVWIGVQVLEKQVVHCFHFTGNRQRVRYKAAVSALLICQSLLTDQPLGNLDHLPG